MQEFFEKPKPQKQPEKRDDSGDFAKSPERKSWLEMMRNAREFLTGWEFKKPGKKEITQALMTIMVLFGNGSFIDAMTSGRPGAKDAFYDNLTKQTREMSPEDLKQRVETYSQIKIIFPSQTPELTFYEDIKVPTVGWNNEKLMVLMRVLNELPPHFYYPVMNRPAKEVQFALVGDISYLKGKEGWSRGGWCACGKTREVEQIVFQDNFSDEDFGKVIVHDLTHRVTADDFPSYEQRLLDILEIKDGKEIRNLLSPQKLKIPELLRYALRGIQEEKTLVLGAIKGIFDTRIIEKFDLEYGSLDAAEFMAVSAEFYIKGKNQFMEIYSYLGKSKAEKLYEFMRQDIFLGKEYFPNE